ncbi:MAG: organic hydroperoxide resistance protein [Staphylococcus epidermidis]|nr:organic hydroperoxide resistance protein [Staphylococcus epidermidis]
MANSIYSTTMISNGGRDGRVFSPDNTFVQNLATPKEMGGQGGNDTNPEQLFAAGYSACFNSALSLILSQNKISDANPEVELGADIKVTLENMSQQDAEKFVEQAHQFCPYSKATRGNIDVQIDVTAQ